MNRIIAVLAVLAVGLLPACAQQQDESGQLRVAAAAEKTQDAGSAKVAMEMKMSGGPQDVAVTAEGAFDFAGLRGSMVMDLGALGEQLGGAKIEMIMDGSTVYLQLPNAAQRGIPTTWVKMDAETLTGGGLDQSGLSNNDPSQTMEMLRGVSDDVEEVGTEDIRGTSTTHYKATLDLEKALEEASDKAKKAVRQQLDILGTTTMPVDVWVDEEGLLRRYETTVDMSQADTGGAPAGSTPTSMFMRMDLYDFGTEVNVEPPPANDVTDYAELQGGGGG